MTDPRELIAVLLELNATEERSVASFTPGLVGMFGSLALMNRFLADIDVALVKGSISAPLKARSKNLTRTFIPQMAGINSITDLSKVEVSAEKLRTVCSDSHESRGEGVKAILAALISILDSACNIN
ncbi:hypothetical protein [Geotalea sp. SG265]|uniref:hypothetical protein n=1 Tax=Geotalea sp. SG265 TaxID=2922867 RepID=UPI001FAEC0EA|nr:hypothetical protein [Geotalea sp. SG265]